MKSTSAQIDYQSMLIIRDVTLNEIYQRHFSENYLLRAVSMFRCTIDYYWPTPAQNAAAAASPSPTNK